MNLRIARNIHTDTIDIIDLDDENFKVDVTGDFKNAVIYWLEANDDKRVLNADNVKYKITLKTTYYLPV